MNVGLTKETSQNYFVNAKNNNWIQRRDPWDLVHFPQSFTSMLFPANSPGMRFYYDALPHDGSNPNAFSQLVDKTKHKRRNRVLVTWYHNNLSSIEFHVSCLPTVSRNVSRLHFDDYIRPQHKTVSIVQYFKRRIHLCNLVIVVLPCTNIAHSRPSASIVTDFPLNLTIGIEHYLRTLNHLDLHYIVTYLKIEKETFKSLLRYCIMLEYRVRPWKQNVNTKLPRVVHCLLFVTSNRSRFFKMLQE